MTIGEAKRAALQIIDGYSENGYVTSDEQPAKADYCLRMSALINQALLRVIQAFPLIKEFSFDEEERRECWDGVHYPVPDDFKEVLLIRKREESDWGPGEYGVFGGELIVPYKSNPMVYYSALPTYIEVAASDDEEIEVAEAGARMIPLFLAAMLLSEDNPALSIRLLNQFEAGLAESLSAGWVAPAV